MRWRVWPISFICLGPIASMWVMIPPLVELIDDLEPMSQGTAEANPKVRISVKSLSIRAALEENISGGTLRDCNGMWGNVEPR